MLQIRETTYRGRKGFLLCGTHENCIGVDGRVRVFVERREVAEDVREKIKAGKEWSLLDYCEDGSGVLVDYDGEDYRG